MRIALTTGAKYADVQSMRALFGVTLAQLLIAVALDLMPLPALRCRCARLRRWARFAAGECEDRILWALDAGGRRLCGLSTCLVQALTAELLLAAPDRPLSLTIGVKKSRGTSFEAHAWITREGRVIVGGAVSDQFVPMVEWHST